MAVAREIDILISARDAASATFRQVERNAKSAMRNVNATGSGGGGGGGFGAAMAQQAGGLGRMAGGAATGLAVGGVAAGIAAATAAVVKGTAAAIDYEHQLAQVNTMLSGDSTAIMATYKTELAAMSAAYGQSTAVLAKGLYDVLSSGVPAADALGVLEVATRAAVGGNTDAATSVDALTTVLNAYGLQATAAGSVSDVMFQIVKDGKTNFSQLAANISTIAPLANAAGISFNELGAYIAQAVKVEKPERAMTQLSAVMRASANAGKPLMEFLREFQGMSLSQILAVDGMDSEAAKGVVLLTRDMQGLNAEMDRMKNATGATEEAFGKMANTQKFHLAQLNQSWQEMLRDIGNGITGMFDLNAAMDATGNVIRNIPEYFSRAVLDIQITGLSLVQMMRENWLLIGQFIGNVIDNIAQQFGEMIAAVGNGIEAISQGNFKDALQAGKDLLAATFKVDIAARLDEISEATFGEQGQKERAAREANDPYIQGLQSTVAELVAERDAITGKIADENAAFARRVVGDTAGAMADLSSKANTEAAAEDEKKKKAAAEEKAAGPGPFSGPIAAAVTESRFLSADYFRVMEQAGGNAPLVRGQDGTQAAAGTPASTAADQMKKQSELLKAGVDLLNRILAKVEDATAEPLTLVEARI